MSGAGQALRKEASNSQEAEQKSITAAIFVRASPLCCYRQAAHSIEQVGRCGNMLDDTDLGEVYVKNCDAKCRAGSRYGTAYAVNKQRNHQFEPCQGGTQLIPPD